MGGAAYEDSLKTEPDSTTKFLTTLAEKSGVTVEQVSSVLAALDGLGYAYIPKPVDTAVAGSTDAPGVAS